MPKPPQPGPTRSVPRRALRAGWDALTRWRRASSDAPEPRRAVLEELEPRLLYSADSPQALVTDAVVRLVQEHQPASPAQAAFAAHAAGASMPDGGAATGAGPGLGPDKRRDEPLDEHLDDPISEPTIERPNQRGS